jgi:serine/threonine-protein kinase
MPAEVGSAATKSDSRRFVWPAVAVGLLAFGLWGWLKPDAAPVVSRYGLSLPPEQAYADPFNPGLAFSPDGSSLVYVGPNNQLWVKRRDQYEAAPIAGTEGAQSPVYSPDGDWLAFVVGGQLRRVPAVGGSATVLSDSMEPGVQSLAWQDDGTIVVTAVQFRLGRVPDVGGPVEILYDPDELVMQPSALPGSRGVLFKACDGTCQVSELRVLEFASGEARTLLPGVAHASYVPTGHIIYVRPDGAVFGVGFDLGSLEITSAPVPLFDGVQVAIGVVPDLAISPVGDLIVVLGPAGQSGAGVAEPVWVDRTGRATLVDETWTLNPGPNRGWALSPDGTKLATKVVNDAGTNIWIKELDDGPFTRLTFADADDERPRWTPDGMSVLFLSDRAGENDLYVRRADGTGSADVVLDVTESILEARYSSDGEWIVFRTAGVAGGIGMRDIWAVRPGVDSVPMPLLQEPYDEKAPAISPDGRWLAYESNQTGRDEIFVRPFPDVDSGQWQVSINGGGMPLWAHSGRELFYVDGDGNMVAAQVETEPTFGRGEQRILFEAGAVYLLSGNYTPFDIHPDDERFLMMRIVGAEDDAGPRQMIVVENWFEEVKEKMGN